MTKLSKFRVLKGKHHQNERVEIVEDGKKITKEIVKTYREGEVFESKLDICARFNPKDPAASRKFEAVEDSVPISSGTTNMAKPEPLPISPPLPPTRISVHNAGATLDGMTEDELRKTADAEEFNHKNIKAGDRSKLLDALKKHLGV